MLQTSIVILLVAASVWYLAGKLRAAFRKDPGCAHCSAAPPQR
ncbi:MAG: hypothetical protein NW241_02560 [Bacteroidia bacterium]|nr:hypothetical protein [Bacteroidia bacterium]